VLLNVLRCAMSLVGQHPLQPGQLEGHLYPENYVVLRPGLTGLWQLAARREDALALRAILDHAYLSGCRWSRTWPSCAPPWAHVESEPGGRSAYTAVPPDPDPPLFGQLRQCPTVRHSLSRRASSITRSSGLSAAAILASPSTNMGMIAS
jgi:hypothetical protein